jgi:acyl dehydratase
MTVDATMLLEQAVHIDVAWTPDDVMLYALAVGLGRPDPTYFLDFTTENSSGRPLRVLPAFAALLATRTEPPIPGTYDPAAGLHAGQSFCMLKNLPVEGKARIQWTTVDVTDRPRGVLVVQRAVATDVGTGEALFVADSSSFILGAKSGRRGDGNHDRAPERQRSADLIMDVSTTVDQALLYRLTGDRNPLHTDPDVARRVGFDRPILHGMCTFGVVARALACKVFDEDPARLQSMESRFTRPVWPGETLRIEAWDEGDSAFSFTVRNDAGDYVMSHGSISGRMSGA